MVEAAQKVDAQRGVELQAEEEAAVAQEEADAAGVELELAEARLVEEDKLEEEARQVTVTPTLGSR